MIILNKEQIAELRQFVVGAANPPVTREELHALCDTAELGLLAMESLRSKEGPDASHQARAITQDEWNKLYNELKALELEEVQAIERSQVAGK